MANHLPTAMMMAAVMTTTMVLRRLKMEMGQPMSKKKAKTTVKSLRRAAVVTGVARALRAAALAPAPVQAAPLKLGRVEMTMMTMMMMRVERRRGTATMVPMSHYSKAPSQVGSN